MLSFEGAVAACRSMPTAMYAPSIRLPLTLDHSFLRGKYKEYFGHTRIVGKGGLYSQTSFFNKYEMLHGFIKGVSGGCFVLINK